jgi:hypothetical protein
MTISYIDEERDYPLVNDRHAMATGWVLGAFMKTQTTLPVLDPEGNYTCAFIVETDFGPVTVTVGAPHD